MTKVVVIYYSAKGTCMRLLRLSPKERRMRARRFAYVALPSSHRRKQSIRTRRRAHVESTAAIQGCDQRGHALGRWTGLGSPERASGTSTHTIEQDLDRARRDVAN